MEDTLRSMQPRLRLAGGFETILSSHPIPAGMVVCVPPLVNSKTWGSMGLLRAAGLIAAAAATVAEGARTRRRRRASGWRLLIYT